MKSWRRNGLTVKMTPLKTEAVDLWNGRRRCHRLLEDFCLIIVSHGLEQRVQVPKGFDTDFATIPVFCQMVLGNSDTYAEAATLHDWLCTTHVPRFICNAWMRSALFCLGAPMWKQRAFYWGLMLFGYDSPLANAINKLRRKNTK